MTARAFWIIVGSPENFATTRANGFTIQSIKSRHRKKAEQMNPGDRLAWYVTGVKSFAGVASITSECFEDHTPIWKSTNKQRDAEDYPWRFHIRADCVLPDGGYVEAEPIARKMTYVGKWPAANWTLAFQGNVHKVDEGDFALIEAAVNAAALAGVGD